MRRAVLLAPLAGLAAWWILAPGTTGDVPSPRPDEAQAPLPRTSSAPSVRTDVRIETDRSTHEPAAEDSVPAPTMAGPGFTDWVAVLPLAVSSVGLDALDPWQDEQTAAGILCSGGAAVAPRELDAWVEASVWNREARSVWAVARRSTGAARVEAVRALVERNGHGDCELVTVLERAHGSGRQAPVIQPTHGDPAAIRAADARALRRLQRGEKLSGSAG